VLIDTGAIVAFLDRRDLWHEWAREQMAEIAPPLLTCEAVISEATFLLRRLPGGPQAMLGLLEQGVVAIRFALADHLSRVSDLMRRYADTPMSLADGCLVRMSEILSGSLVFTLDSDFRIYRRHGRQAIPLLIPPNR
jgi:predicted nucleic acid-binding protein